MLCCDNCDFTFHFTCTQPPLMPDQQISESEAWYCRQCAHTIKQKTNPERAPGPYGPIFDLSASLNPHIFSLPASVRRNTNAELNKTRDAKELDFHDLLKNPERCLARYSADETVDNRKRRGVRLSPLPHLTFHQHIHFAPFYPALLPPCYFGFCVLHKILFSI